MKTPNPLPHGNPDGSTHPVENKRYIVCTPAIERLSAFSLNCVENQVNGALLYGPQRHGKTCGRRFTSRVLAQSVPGTFVTNVACADYARVTQRTFFGDLLGSVGHALADKGDGPMRRDRFIEYLYDQAAALPDRRVVLQADEAQRLCEERYKWLIDVHNALDEAGINLVVFLFGQPELLTIRTGFSKAGKKQIVGRFMVETHAFRGLRSAGDVRSTLDSYDNKSEFPAGSGISFTRHYFPGAWEAGWRLSSLADGFWRAFDAVHHKATHRPLREIPMQYFCRAVERILRAEGSHAGQTPEICAKKLDVAVAASGFRNAVAFGGPGDEPPAKDK